MSVTIAMSASYHDDHVVHLTCADDRVQTAAIAIDLGSTSRGLQTWLQILSQRLLTTGLTRSVEVSCATTWTEGSISLPASVFSCSAWERGSRCPSPPRWSWRRSHLPGRESAPQSTTPSESSAVPPEPPSSAA